MVISEVGQIVHKFPMKSHLIRNKFNSTITKGSMDKTVRLTYDKRIIERNFKTRPFGTRKFNVIQSTSLIKY